jgi:hypothetical protein
MHKIFTTCAGPQAGYFLNQLLCNMLIWVAGYTTESKLHNLFREKG